MYTVCVYKASVLAGIKNVSEISISEVADDEVAVKNVRVDLYSRERMIATDAHTFAD